MQRVLIRQNSPCCRSRSKESTIGQTDNCRELPFVEKDHLRIQSLEGDVRSLQDEV